LVGTITLAILTACDDKQGMSSAPPPTPTELQHYVTGAAAQALTASGEFRLASASASSGRPTITSEHAGALAQAYVQSFGPALKGIWERQRGGPMDLADLKIARRILFANTPYEEFPNGFHPAFARGFGPFYLVTFTVGDQPAIVVAVSAYATDVAINKSGLLDMPTLDGNVFFDEVVPVDGHTFFPLTPEEAVAHVGQLTGARTARVPELVRPNADYSPALAAWHLTLDRQVPVAAIAGEARGRRFETRELYVGPAVRWKWQAATVEQPAVVEAYAMPLGADSLSATPKRYVPVTLKIRPGHATIFDAVADAATAAGGQ